MLKAFSFDSQFCNWVKVILKSANLSFSVNEKSVDFMSCKRGIRQGDPLSPLLFCIAEEVLNRGISVLFSSGQLKAMSGPKGFKFPSHVLYADDVMVFCNGSKRNLQVPMKLFSDYAAISGQFLSLPKCKFYAANLSANKGAVISNTLGFSTGELPFFFI